MAPSLCARAKPSYILWSNHIRVLSSNLQCVAIIIFVYVFHVHLITEKLHYVYRDTPHMHICYTRINTKLKHIWTQKLRISKRHHNIIYMCNARCIAESTLHDGDYMLGRRKPTSDLAFDGWWRFFCGVGNSPRWTTKEKSGNVLLSRFQALYIYRFLRAIPLYIKWCWAYDGTIV